MYYLLVSPDTFYLMVVHLAVVAHIIHGPRLLHNMVAHVGLRTCPLLSSPDTYYLMAVHLAGGA